MPVNKTLLLLFCVLITSCTRSYKICGHSSVSRMDGHVLYLKTLQDDGWMNIDSADIVHGTFAMSGSLDSIVMTMLYIGDTPIMPVVLENGNISIAITYKQIRVEGTPLNNALNNFIHKHNMLDAQIADLEREEARMIMDGHDYDSVKRKLLAKNDALLDEFNTYVQNFILEHSDDVLGPNIFMMLCSSLPYPFITPEIRNILDQVPLSFKKNWMVRDFIREADENQKLIEENARMSANNN